ncbi:hypothetical protein LV84_03774 [Algoriphagus ratkowskyi]|nr:hypothetical protein LV84_03774 [Algoriphagus ratkowskyi]
MRLQLGIIITSVFFGLISSQVEAQSRNFVDVSYDRGPMIGNNKVWANDLINKLNYSGVDVRFGRRSTKNTFYNYINRYPSYGLGFTSAVNYYSEIGRPIGIYAFGEFPFGKVNFNRKVNFSYYSQIGVGFNMNPYDPMTNPINGFVG